MADAKGELPKPIKIEDVIRQERDFLGLSHTVNPDVYRAARQADERAGSGGQAAPAGGNPSQGSTSSDGPWALCLSGGGIRSATFGLGVLQGLAQVGALSRFHYLSTVSGGGYIGSWLSRWIHEEKGDLNVVQTALHGNVSAKYPSGEPRQLRTLRAYSNYLSPVWGLSTDFFTLASIFCRNLLLNWLVLLPLLFALVLVPRLYVGATVGLAPASVDWVWTLIGVAGALIAFGLAFIVADLPSARCPEKAPSDRFPLLCFLPIAAAAALLGIVIGWNSPVVAPEQTLLQTGRWFHYAIAGVVIHVIGCVAGMIWRSRRRMPDRIESRRHAILTNAADMFLIAASGAAGGLLVYALVRWGPEDQVLHATIAAPILLFAFWLATTLYVALVKYWSTEGDREWWARSGAWWLRFALAWALGFGLVVYLPQQIGDLLDGNVEYAAAGGGLWGIVVAAIGYWTKNGAKITDRAQTIAGTIGMRLLDLAAIVFVLALLFAFCMTVDFAVKQAPSKFEFGEATRVQVAAQQIEPGGATSDASVGSIRGTKTGAQSAPRTWGTEYGDRMNSTAVAWPAMLFVIFLALSALSALVVGINTFSLHSMYGNRLVRAYFGGARDPEKREPHWFTGFDFGDNVTMGDLQSGRVSATANRSQNAPADAGTHRLLHIVNIALNLVSPAAGRLEWQQRKAASFTVSKLYSGSDVEGVGFLPSSQYSGISLGRAMTISGAAASSNMGYHSSTPVALVMTLFNVRLGWWLPNPGYKGRVASATKMAQASEPRWALRPLLWEALGATSEHKPYLYLSDGGHFDNLGLYEMVRRGCRRILVVDATSDPKCAYNDLQDVIRKIRVDFGICIEFEAKALEKPRRCVIGRIGYKDGEEGELHYVKPTLCGDEPLDVRHYAEESRVSNPKTPFPHQSTADQFFDEAQFESYRLLGWHTITQLWGVRAGAGGDEPVWPTGESLEEYQQVLAGAAKPARADRAEAADAAAGAKEEKTEKSGLLSDAAARAARALRLDRSVPDR